MTPNEIIAMAREAGMNLTPAQFSGVLEDEVDEFELERFAALVAAKEREACAQVCESWGGRDYEKCAAAIRAKGKP